MYNIDPNTLHPYTQSRTDNEVVIDLTVGTVPRSLHRYSNDQAMADLWVKIGTGCLPKHAVSATCMPSRFAINVRWGNKAPPRIVAQRVAGHTKGECA